MEVDSRVVIAVLALAVLQYRVDLVPAAREDEGITSLRCRGHHLSSRHPAKSSSEKKWTVGGKKAVDAAEARVPAERLVSIVAAEPASEAESFTEPASEARDVSEISEAPCEICGLASSRAASRIHVGAGGMAVPPLLATAAA